MRPNVTLPLRAAAFLLWFAWQVLRSSVAVLGDVLTPGSRATPRVVRLDLDGAGGLHTTAISVLISLTPGTLVLGRDSGRSAVLVHSMYHPSGDQARSDLQDMNRRLVRATTTRRTR